MVYYDDATTPDILAFQDTYLFPWVLFCAGLFMFLMCVGFIYGTSLIDSIYLPHLSPDPLKTIKY